MAGIAEFELAACGSEHAEEQGYEHHVAVVLAKLAVHARDDLGRRCRRALPRAHEVRGDANEALGTRHEQRCRHALARDVSHQEAQHPVLGDEKVVEVAADLPRRLHAGAQIDRKVRARCRKRLRHHRHLQPPRRVELLLQTSEMGVDLVAQALLLERRAEARFQQNRIEGLEQIVDGPELDATRHAVQLGQGRNHDHGKVAQPRLILEPGEHLEPIDLRHHHVEQDEVEAVRLEPRDRLFAVARSLDVGIALEIEMQFQRVDVVVVVIDDEDAGRSSLRSMLGHRAVPMNAGRRTLDHVPPISNHKLAPWSARPRGSGRDSVSPGFLLSPE